jgi:hypothetical protein
VNGVLVLAVLVVTAGCIGGRSGGDSPSGSTGTGGDPPALSSTIEDAVAAGPGRDSGTYQPPSQTEVDQLANAVIALLSGDDPSPPDAVRVGDAVDADRRHVRVVEEDRTDGDLHGWGTYAVRSGAGVPAGVVVEVPHPGADRGTEKLGPRLFAALHGDALLVAGAHRSAGNGADVAHEPSSAFAGVDRAIVGSGTVVLQVHGFDESQHRGSADVVLSSTDATPGPLIRELADALEEAGFRPCVYDGEDCDALAGTRNTEGAHARAVGATFIHLELASDIREPGDRQDELIRVITSVLAH